jgi:hypothetical protein
LKLFDLEGRDYITAVAPRGLVGSNVRVALEIEASIPSGAPENAVRTVSENCRTLRFKTQGFEAE